MDKKELIKYSRQYGISLMLKSRVYGHLQAQEKMHHLYKSYLENKYKKIIDRYRQEDSVLMSDAVPSSKKVWVLWWEGVEEMPEVVKHCCRSIQRHCNGYEMTVLTHENYKKYIKLPEHIVEHFENGDFEIVHLADIIRVFLLCQYGGIWLDATVFLSDDLPMNYLDRAFFSSNTGNRESAFASKGRWSGYFMAVSHSHTILFEFLQEMYTEYWKEHDIILCYFLLDYMLLIAHDHFPVIGRLIDEIPVNNTNVKKLSVELNNVFDRDRWESIKKDTVIHKLSWKRELYPQKDGNETFYGRLLVNDDRKVGYEGCNSCRVK